MRTLNLLDSPRGWCLTLHYRTCSTGNNATTTTTATSVVVSDVVLLDQIGGDVVHKMCSRTEPYSFIAEIKIPGARITTNSFRLDSRSERNEPHQRKKPSKTAFQHDLLLGKNAISVTSEVDHQACFSLQ
ncbi:MAG TPA: hypothetical protein DCR66_08310 [Pseudomonas sp.]|nr:hypothetical protein [Pseudomonas sp.]